MNQLGDRSINKSLKIDIICYSIGITILFLVGYILASYIMNVSSDDSRITPDVVIVGFFLIVVIILGFYVIWMIMDKVKELYE